MNAHVHTDMHGRTGHHAHMRITNKYTALVALGHNRCICLSVCLYICLSLSSLSSCLPLSFPICLCFTSLVELVSRSWTDVSSHVITVR